jgi:hypothetical protein
MIFAVLRLTRIILFTASIPLLVIARFKYSKFSAWLLLVLATVFGWFLPYTHMSLRAPMIHEFDRAERQAAEVHAPPSPTDPKPRWALGLGQPVWNR